MKYKWLNLENNKKLIVFFNGWGMDDCVVKHLNPENYDVLMFYDYNTLESDFDWGLLDNYSEKNLIAWSMGVMIASKFNADKLFANTVAINGTLKPINIEFGIHPKIYDLTINGFDEKGRDRFISSMFQVKQNINCGRDIENQKSELIVLKENVSNESFKYNKVIISDSDKIIPTKSQVKYWGKEPNYSGGHCIFLDFEKWSHLL